jgi:hypothetical protein
MASLVLAFSLIRSFILMFSRSWDFKNIRPQVLYLLHPSINDTQYVLYNIISLRPHTAGNSYPCVRPSLKV